MKRLIIFLLGLVLAGCANTVMGKTIREQTLQSYRQIATEKGFDLPEDPKFTSCTAEKLVGQSYQKVMDCWGKPSGYEVGTRGDGYVLYPSNATLLGHLANSTSGLKVLLKEWVVVDVIRQEK